MKFTVEAWDSDYGAPTEPEMEDASENVDPSVELSSEDWRPLLPETDPIDDVLFVDGVRRVDATLWIDQPPDFPGFSLAATYAAGAVRCNDRAVLEVAEVDRGLFTSSAAEDIVSSVGTYEVRATKGTTSEELWLGIQQRMGDLEAKVAHKAGGAELLVVDGPLSHARDLENAVGYVEPGVFMEGRRVERVREGVYRVEGGKFTSCSQPNPRWSFTSSSARIHVDDKIIAKNAVFKVKSVPAFYLPYLYYPISSDGRSTGLLFPSFGYSSIRGYTLGSGFFWAMGRSWDQTFIVDYYSKIGTGLGHELRYRSHTPSRGTFRTYMIRVKDSEELDWDIDWRGLQMLPGQVRATVNVRQYSNLLFNSRFQESFNRITSRTQRWTGSLDRDLKLATLTLRADRTTTFFGVDSNRVNGHLPSLVLRRFPRQVGWGGIVFGLNAAAERLEWGTQDKTDRWARFDVAPTVSRPLRLSFLEVNPEVGYRYTELYWAGRDRNWGYAEYQLGKIETAVANGVERRPARAASARMLAGAIAGMRKAIADRNGRAMDTSMETLTATCSACHQAERVPFMTVAQPSVRASAIHFTQAPAPKNTPSP